ncbi:PTS sugar transporter subunit IIA [Clostridium sp. LBM24168]
MFNFLKGSFVLAAPVDGKVVDLSEIQDEVFAQKTVGDGVAIQPSGDVIVSPACGKVTIIFNTNHAFGMELENGAEVLVHIGIDTVELKGNGFKRLVKEGAIVKEGDEIIKIDKEYIEDKGYSLMTSVLITNVDNVGCINYINLNSDVKAGKDAVVNYKMK